VSVSSTDLLTLGPLDKNTEGQLIMTKLSQLSGRVNGRHTVNSDLLADKPLRWMFIHVRFGRRGLHWWGRRLSFRTVTVLHLQRKGNVTL
jgi:hypothetical protein